MKEAYGYLLIAVASIIWGTMGIFGELAFTYGINPPTLISLRLLISALTLLVPIALFRKELFKIQRRDLPKFLIFGIVATALQRVTYFYAVDLTTVTMAAMLFFTYPIFVTIFASISFKEKITPTTIFAIILTFSGNALVIKAYETSWLDANLSGIIFGILSSVFFVFYFLITKELRNSYTNWTLLLYGETIGAIALTPIIFSSFSAIIDYPQQLWLLIFIIAWFPNLLAYLLYSYALKHVKYSKGSILAVLEPISAAILSATILTERFEPPQILGIILALTGVILLFYKPKIKN
ncbi:MAG TPA: EamA family transporter [Acidobacteriota bacterium]|nr:EamA family transporter [Acidobacteriota bacterium]